MQWRLFKSWKNWNFWCTIFLCLVGTLGAMCHHKETWISRYFSRNHEPDCVPEIGLSYSQSMSVYYPSGEYKLSIHFFLEHRYAIVFTHNILHPSNGYLVHDGYKCAIEIFSTEFQYNFSHLCNTIFIHINMKYYFFIKRFLLLKIDWLTDWLSKHS